MYRCLFKYLKFRGFYKVFIMPQYINSPALKNGGYIGFGLSIILSLRHYFVSAQYLENNLVEFNQILYVHFY